MIRIRSWLVVAVAAMLSTALIGAAEAQTQGQGPRGAGMNRGSLLGLASLESVQKELKITDEQAAKLKEAAEKLRGEMREQFTSVREIQDRAARGAKLAELNKQLDEKAGQQAREILAREQVMRLYQIRLQVRGNVYALNSRFIAARLKLTDEQKEKAAAIQKATEEKTAAAFTGLRDLDENQRREKMAEMRTAMIKIRSDADAQALGLLTAEQKEALEKAKGEKFEL